jgi:hypothetical protein
MFIPDANLQPEFFHAFEKEFVYLYFLSETSCPFRRAAHPPFIGRKRTLPGIPYQDSF